MRVWTLAQYNELELRLVPTTIWSWVQCSNQCITVPLCRLKLLNVGAYMSSSFPSSIASRGLSGWATQMRKKIRTIWGKLRKICQNLMKEWGNWNSCPLRDCDADYSPALWYFTNDKWKRSKDQNMINQINCNTHTHQHLS